MRQHGAERPAQPVGDHLEGEAALVAQPHDVPLRLRQGRDGPAQGIAELLLHQPLVRAGRRLRLGRLQDDVGAAVEEYR